MAHGNQINLRPSSGRDYKFRRSAKKETTRKRRHAPVQEDEMGGKGYLRCTKGWMD